MSRTDGGYIGEGLHVRGTIAGSGDIAIDGRVDGPIAVDGNLVVGETGIVVGGVRAGTVTVAGEVRGDVVADGAVALRETGLVAGDVRAARVAIDDGGALHGAITMDFAVPGDEA